MALTRILRTTKVTVTRTFYADEAPINADSGNVTATLKRLDGTLVNTATAGHPGPVGEYTYPVPASAVLDAFRLEWSGLFGGVTITVYDYVEVVGGFLFGLAEARNRHRGLNDTNRYTTDILAEKRTEIEQEFENICGQAWVPRFARFALSGRGYEQLATPVTMLRTLRAVTIGGVAFTQTELDAVSLTDSGILRRPTGSMWPAGYRNVIVEVEHGNDYPPLPISEAGILRLRSRLSTTTTEIPDRAISYSVAEGGTYRLSTPGRQRTGIPEIDGVLERPGYTLRRPRAAVA
jgi:hypothetical protein